MSGDSVLIVASSGRMLAEAAHRAGLRALVIDCYCDADLCRYANDAVRVPSLAAEHVASAFYALRKSYLFESAVYGSGLENHPETLIFLDRHCRVFGNSPDTFLKLQRPAEFFAALARLRIPFPDVTFTPPLHGENWLQKPMQGQGGVGIRHYVARERIPGSQVLKDYLVPKLRLANAEREAPASHFAKLELGEMGSQRSCWESANAPRALRGNDNKSVYWQRFQPGKQGSVLFLADGWRACVVGFNTQFTINLGDGLEFTFSGLINHSTLFRTQKALVSAWLDRCVQAFALRGLSSLDFIHDGEQVYVLEINPRPPASMQLYDGLLASHIAACNGRLPDALPEPCGFAGIKIVYAGEDVRIGKDFVWPDGAKDIPSEGSICRKHEPICTLAATSATPQQVSAMLANKEQQIINQVIKVQCDGISSECE